MGSEDDDSDSVDPDSGANRKGGKNKNKKESISFWNRQVIFPLWIREYSPNMSVFLTSLHTYYSTELWPTLNLIWETLSSEQALESESQSGSESSESDYHSKSFITSRLHSPFPYTTTRILPHKIWGGSQECLQKQLTLAECRAETWVALHELKSEEFLIRELGVSNFNVK